LEVGEKYAIHDAAQAMARTEPAWAARTIVALQLAAIAPVPTTTLGASDNKSEKGSPENNDNTAKETAAPAEKKRKERAGEKRAREREPPPRHFLQRKK
jgi:hypothetical protein